MGLFNFSTQCICMRTGSLSTVLWKDTPSTKENCICGSENWLWILTQLSGQLCTDKCTCAANTYSLGKPTFRFWKWAAHCFKLQTLVIKDANEFDSLFKDYILKLWDYGYFQVLNRDCAMRTYLSTSSLFTLHKFSRSWCSLKIKYNIKH